MKIIKNIEALSTKRRKLQVSRRGVKIEVAGKDGRGRTEKRAPRRPQRKSFTRCKYEYTTSDFPPPHRLERQQHKTCKHRHASEYHKPRVHYLICLFHRFTTVISITCSIRHIPSCHHHSGDKTDIKGPHTRSLISQSSIFNSPLNRKPL